MADNVSHLNESVQVNLLLGSDPIAEFNMNNVAIYSSNRIVGKFDSNNRVATFTGSDEVGSFFGANSQEKKYSDVIFGNTRSPLSAKGSVSLIYWRATAETVSATSAKLQGIQNSEATLLPQLQQITSGTFNITVDGTEVSVGSLDFSSISEVGEAVAILQAQITTATVNYSNLAFSVTSNSTGSISIIQRATGDVAELIGLGVEATAANGSDEQELPAETKLECLTAYVNDFGGHSFIDPLTDSEKLAIAPAVQSANKMFYQAITDKSQNSTNPTVSVEYKITLAGYTNFRTILSSDPRAAVAYMGVVHSVNMDAEASTITIEKKQFVGITPDNYSRTELRIARQAGIDLYGITKNQGYVVASWGRSQADTIYNRMCFVESLRVAEFNLMATTATKIPNTPQGQAVAVSTMESVLDKYIRNNYIGVGLTWKGQVPFMQDQAELFNQRLQNNGYVIQGGSFESLTLQQRIERELPIFQIAFIEAGAVHIMIINVYPQE